MSSKENQAAAADAGAETALVFELEYVAVEGRRRLYDVAEEKLADAGVALTPPLFARFGVDRPVKSLVSGVASVFPGCSVSAGKTAGAIRDALVKALTRNDQALNPALAEALAKSGEKTRAGAVTCLDASAASALAEAVGLTGSGVVIRPCEAETPFGMEAWQALAEQLQVPVSRCLAVVTSAAACRGALTAGMCTYVVPDAFSSFQDFGGADYVRDALDAGELLQALARTEASS